MKKILFLMVFALIATLGFGQTKKTPTKTPVQTEQLASPDSGPKMHFESDIVDYGELEKNGEPLRVWEFENTGDAPLVIKNARGSCGCTVPIWPKEPIMPGEKSKIEVRYATNRVGKINKTITLTTNEIPDNTHVIKVIGKVFDQEDAIPAGGKNIFGGGE